MPQDTLLVELTNRLASFEDARAMDLSPTMRLYVADAGTDVVRSFQLSFLPGDEVTTSSDSGRTGNSGVVLVPSGLLGGSGTDPGLFQEPSSVDASTALFVNVADAGNGRIQRFSSDGALVEVLPVPENPNANEGANPGFRHDQPAVDGQGSGARPTRVESTSADDIIVLEAGSRQLLMTDVRRRAWMTPGDAQRRSIDPVDVEFIRSRILIADAFGNRVFVYDRFGSLVGIMDMGGEYPLAAIIPVPSGVAVLAGRDLAWWPQGVAESASEAQQEQLSQPSEEVTEEPIGRRPIIIRFRTTEQIMDARLIRDRLLILTNRSLFVVSTNMDAP